MAIKVYSTPECPWCKETKNFLKKNKVKFENIDVSDNKKAHEEMIKKSGQHGVPVIDFNGKIIVGYNEEELESLLKDN
jgi:glutaredoxin-like YruB-family protein